MEMKKTEVGIAELKAKLSACLRVVRKGGEIVVKDGETPMARLVPYEKSRNCLEVIPPTGSWENIRKLKFERLKGLRPGAVDEALRETRRDRFEELNF
jgi:prevent-host-death family protein